MTNGLTTGACAEILNDLVEMRAFTSDFVHGQVLEGLLHARVRFSRGNNRKRAFIRIHPDDLRIYIERHHANLLQEYDRTFHGERQAS